MHWVRNLDRTVSFFLGRMITDLFYQIGFRKKNTEGESLKQNSTNSSMFGYPLERCSSLKENIPYRSGYLTPGPS